MRATGCVVLRPLASLRLVAASRLSSYLFLVITPPDRLNLGPTEASQVFLEQQVRWLSLEELSREPDLENLVTLPTRPNSEFEGSIRQILLIADIPREEIRHTSAAK